MRLNGDPQVSKRQQEEISGGVSAKSSGAVEDNRKRVSVSPRTGHPPKVAVPVAGRGRNDPEARGSARVGRHADKGGGVGARRRPASAGTRFFQRCLAANRGTAAEARRDFRASVYQQIQQVDGQQGELTIERQCQLGTVSRAGYYRSFQVTAPHEEEAKLRDALQRIALENRSYGYRRVTHELRARGWPVNHKRVARLMRSDQLLAVRKRRFAPVTTNSQHSFEVYLNVARQLRATAVNQLWVADFTYIRLGREDVFLAVVLDAFSRRVVGWNLSRSLQADLPLTALKQAIAARQPAPGLIHHSDRGVQYASSIYIDTLVQHGIVPSMSRPGNPYDNAKCESFIKTLKQEEIYCSQYQDLDDLRLQLADFLERYYNGQRLHSALGYQSPEAFERPAGAQPSAISSAAALSFFRHEEIYPDASL
jgi:putative transposase